jgi:hypothetical protein
MDFLFFILFFNLILLCWVGVHSGIYKGSYNISHLNSSPLSFSFLHPHLRNSFNRYLFFHLHSYAHSVCTIFTLSHPFLTSSPLTHCYQLSPGTGSTCSSQLFSDFATGKEKGLTFLLV